MTPLMKILEMQLGGFSWLSMQRMSGYVLSHFCTYV